MVINSDMYALMPTGVFGLTVRPGRDDRIFRQTLTDVEFCLADVMTLFVR